MKHHKFWAWAAVVCMVLAIYTGHNHKLPFLETTRFIKKGSGGNL